MSEKPFKLLHVPLVTLERIVRQMNPIELIELCLSSNVFADFVKSAHLNETKVSVSFMKLKEPHALRTRFQIEMVGRGAFDVCIYEQKNDNRVWSKNRMVEGKPVESIRGEKQYQRREELRFRTRDYKQLTKIFMDLLQSTFKTKIGVADFDADVAYDSSSKAELESNFQQESVKNAHSFSFLGLTVPHDSLEKFIENLDEIQSLCVRCHVDSVVQPRKLPIINKLIVDRGCWITKELFWELKCADISIRNHRLTDCDVNIFIKNWLNGTDRRLRSLKLSAEREFDMRGSGLVRGFENHLQPWNMNRRSRKFKIMPDRDDRYDINCEHARDIERKDGLLASLVVSDGDFLFLVWHQRFRAEKSQ